MTGPSGEQARARAIVDAATLEPLTRYMAGRFFGRSDGPDRGREAAEALGWIEPDTAALTPGGRLAADSCREWRFWEERARRLPFETGTPPLAAAHFAGRSVVEIGCGAGANLMSLEGIAGRLQGVEPAAAYIGLGALFREAAGLPPLRVHEGSGEAIPLPDASADLVLCVTAHQYMDVPRALAEMARVLRPGGELLLVGGTLASYVRGHLALRELAPGRLRAHALTVANTLAFLALGRRAIRPRGPGGTSRPIYPPARSMVRMIRAAGLAPAGPPFRHGDETVFRAHRPG